MIKTFNYKDIIEYSYRDYVKWKVREVVHEMRWEIEAYYEVTINSRIVRIVFYPDIIEPRIVLDLKGFFELIDKIDDRYKYVKNIYGSKKSI